MTNTFDTYQINYRYDISYTQKLNILQILSRISFNNLKFDFSKDSHIFVCNIKIVKV